MNLVLSRNKAWSLDKMKASSNPQVSQWLDERAKALLNGERDWLREEEIYQGRGGGAFISLRNFRKDSSIRLEFDGVTVRHNSAVVGGNAPRSITSCDLRQSGGIYFDNECRQEKNANDCRKRGYVRQSCTGIEMLSVHLNNNSASVAGGGLFVRSPNNLTTYGILDKSLLPRECEMDEKDDGGVCFRNNRISVCFAYALTLSKLVSFAVIRAVVERDMGLR